MAYAKKQTTDYGALIETLKRGGPERLYLLYGEEDYLRESFFGELKKLCVDGGGDFNHHRINGEILDQGALNEAINAMPFMGERTLIELRNFKINECKDEAAESLKVLLSDIPDYATVAIVLPTGSELDGRLVVTKMLKKLGNAIEFTTQPQSLLLNWITRRFKDMGKNIGRKECERLIFISGERMTGLVPEIEKIGSFVKGDTVTEEDINRLAQHIPEAKIFEMTDALASGRYDKAAELLAELMQSGEHPIKTLGMIGFQMRRLYTARLAIDSGLGKKFLIETHNIRNDYVVDKLINSAKRFSTEQIKNAVELCAESDYLMKSSSRDDGDILKDWLLRFAVGGVA